MSTLTDKAWDSLRTGKTEFEVGVYTFNGCIVRITKRQEPHQYITRKGDEKTKSARYWGSIVFPNGIETQFSEERGGAVARSTGFAVKEEQDKYKQEGDNYALPYERNK